MDKIKQLELKKLFKELDWMQSECEYKNEIIVDIDSNFIKDVNFYLDQFPDLKKEFEDKMNQKIQEIIDSKKENDININDDEDIDIEDNDVEDEVEDLDDIEDETKEEVSKSSKIKKFYREVVKLTHPDKVKDSKLNQLYIEATDFYDKNDIIGIYSICSQLNIQYEIDEIDMFYVKEKIRVLKERIFFIESTYTWRWFNATDQDKNSVIEGYIKARLK
jgi:hypothetical protein